VLPFSSASAPNGWQDLLIIYIST